MATAHTPGPWKLWKHTAEAHESLTAGDDWTVRGDDGQAVCVEGTAYEADANAHLIAAAPELLEALIAAEREIKAFARAFGHGVMTEPTLANTRAAIAKATGEASQ